MAAASAWQTPQPSKARHPDEEHPQVYIPVDVPRRGDGRVHFSVHTGPTHALESFHESFHLAFHLSVHQDGAYRGEIPPLGRWRNRFIDGFTEPRNPTRGPRADDPCVSACSTRRKRAHAFPHVRGGKAPGRIAA